MSSQQWVTEIYHHSRVSITCDANNTTETKTLFTLTGAVYLKAIWGEVTTAIGTNHTGGKLVIVSDSLSDDLTTSGVTLSSTGGTAGTIIVKRGLIASTLLRLSSNAGNFDEAATAGVDIFSPLFLVEDFGSTLPTTVGYNYATTNTPGSGVIEWHALWRPLSSDGNLA